MKSVLARFVVGLVRGYEATKVATVQAAAYCRAKMARLLVELRAFLALAKAKVLETVAATKVVTAKAVVSVKVMSAKVVAGLKAFANHPVTRRVAALCLLAAMAMGTAVLLAIGLAVISQALMAGITLVSGLLLACLALVLADLTVSYFATCWTFGSEIGALALEAVSTTTEFVNRQAIALAPVTAPAPVVFA